MSFEKTELENRVHQILWRDWDPIGIRNCGGPDDEYDSYVPSIVKSLQDQNDKLTIAKLLHQHAAQNMGLNSQIEDHLETAQKLRALIW